MIVYSYDNETQDDIEIITFFQSLDFKYVVPEDNGIRLGEHFLKVPYDHQIQVTAQDPVDLIVAYRMIDEDHPKTIHIYDDPDGEELIICQRWGAQPRITYDFRIRVDDLLEAIRGKK